MRTARSLLFSGHIRATVYLFALFTAPADLAYFQSSLNGTKRSRCSERIHSGKYSCPPVRPRSIICSSSLINIVFSFSFPADYSFRCCDSIPVIQTLLGSCLNASFRSLVYTVFFCRPVLPDMTGTGQAPLRRSISGTLQETV